MSTTEERANAALRKRAERERKKQGLTALRGRPRHMTPEEAAGEAELLAQVVDPEDKLSLEELDAAFTPEQVSLQLDYSNAREVGVRLFKWGETPDQRKDRIVLAVLRKDGFNNWRDYERWMASKPQPEPTPTEPAEAASTESVADEPAVSHVGPSLINDETPEQHAITGGQRNMTLREEAQLLAEKEIEREKQGVLKHMLSQGERPLWMLPEE